MDKREDELVEILSKSCTDLKEIEALIKRLFKKTIEQMLNDEMDKHLGYEKNDSFGNNSGNSRNGYNKKTVQSEFGKIEIRVPRDRNGEFTPHIIEKYQKKTENLDDRIIEMYAKGMSNREIEGHMHNIYGVDVSASLISRITNRTMPAVQEWQCRPLKSTYAIVFFSGTPYKVRNDGKSTTKYVYTALGIDMNGIKDILGMWITESESNLFWEQVCSELKTRGIDDINITCYGSINGLSLAISNTFPKAEKQLCIIHQVSSSTKFVSYTDRKELTADLKEIYSTPTLDGAEKKLNEFKEKWDGNYPQVTQSWEERWNELTTFYKYEKEVRHIIYTTNLIRGFQRILRKFSKPLFVYPTDEALSKSIYLSIQEITKSWTHPIPKWETILNKIIKG